MEEKALAELIHPVGFYNTKAKNIKKTAALLSHRGNPLQPCHGTLCDAEAERWPNSPRSPQESNGVTTWEGLWNG
jgi:endonuclease III